MIHDHDDPCVMIHESFLSESRTMAGNKQWMIKQTTYSHTTAHLMNVDQDLPTLWGPNDSSNAVKSEISYNDQPVIHCKKCLYKQD